MLNYSELLRKYIEESGLTLNEISLRLKEHGFNISKGYISQLQNGKTDRPATDELNRALAAVTGGDVDNLLTTSLIEKAPVEIKEKFIRLNALKDLKTKYENNLCCESIVVKEVTRDYESEYIDFLEIPVLGSIAAGQPIEMVQDYDEVEYVDSTYIRGNEAFGLMVKGDSMIGDLITDGDVVICISQQEVLPNDIAVVAVNDESATLKRVAFKGEVCMLIPSNPKMQPMLVPSREVKVIGKVIEVRRRL